MTTTTKPRQSVKPASVTHGTCRLVAAGQLPLSEALDSGEAMLTITPEHGEPSSYTVQRLADSDGRTVGFRLTRLAWLIADRKLYDIDTTAAFGWQCDCPDAQFRNRECKHVHALRNALARNGVAVPFPQKQQPAALPKPEPAEAKASKPTYCRLCGHLESEHVAGFCLP
jgi:hypothetical protein